MTARAYIETDAAGEARVVHINTLRVLASATVFPSVELRKRIWADNKICCECGKPIAAPEDAGLASLHPVKLAHIRPIECFSVAFARELDRRGIPAKKILRRGGR